MNREVLMLVDVLALEKNVDVDVVWRIRSGVGFCGQTPLHRKCGFACANRP